MKRTRCPPKSNAKKLCSSDSESGLPDSSSSEKDTLKVFCRVRPLRNENDQSNITIVLPNTIKVSSVDSNRDGNYKETQYIFRDVFNENTTQDQVFKKTSLDLVKNLLIGKNGLLLAYGITGSGKTYTMNGTSDKIGIMPRCVCLLFNTIKNHLSKKFVFKPDKMNGFEIQSEPDAMLDRHREMTSIIRTPSKFRKKESEIEMLNKWSGRTLYSNSLTPVEDFTKGNSFAVFITYVEIYNNSVYDLIEETEDVLRQRPPQPKLIREDGNRNMYVHGVTEVEVKSSEDAYDLYFKGQRKRHLAGTAMNSQSSRSHSIFTIRVVQAPLNSHGDSLLEKHLLKVSQLSLVDLAGSERTSRTKTVGQRLREAGRINNSLMTLRTCLEILRENQINGTNKIAPYRDSRLTHLLKNYFDGNGDIRMIICISPGADDHEETLQVLKFSEMSQEVLVNRPPPPVRPNQVFATPTPIFATPNKKRNINNNIRPTPLETDIDATPKDAIDRGFNLNWTTFFMPKFPDFNEPRHNNDLVSIIETRMLKEKESTDILHSMVSRMRTNMMDIESAATCRNIDLQRLTQQLDDKHAKCLDMERRNSELKMKLVTSENSVKLLKEEVAVRDLKLSKEQDEVMRERHRYKTKLAHNKERFNKEMEVKLQRQKSVLEFEILERDRKMQRVKRALDTPSCTSVMHGILSQKKSGAATPSKSSRLNSDSSTPSTSAVSKPRTPGFHFRTRENLNVAQQVVGTLDLATTIPSSHASRALYPPIAVSDPRHRRSRSAGGNDHWLDHRPLNAIPLNTLMQPVIKRRKSVTKLTDVKDIVNPTTSKYCLTTQTLDSDGDLETCLIKGDVVPTSGGGAQVMFNDVEVLHHKSPQTSPIKGIMKSPKSITASTSKATIEDRCAVAFEGHQAK